MKHQPYRYLFALTIFAFLCLATSAQAQVVSWAGRVDAGADLDILHAPDRRERGLGSPFRVSGFGPGMRYPGLGRLLGISARDLARADVIAFELNGTHPGGNGISNGWESSTWTFSDGINTLTVRFNERVHPSQYASMYPALVANGSIRGADGSIGSGAIAYNAFFGMCPSSRAVISYILFDLDVVRPAINTASPNFSIKVAGGHVDDGSFGEGTPDPDAIGIFSACPSGK